MPADFRHAVYSASFNFVRVLATSVRQADLHHIPRHGQYDYSLLVVVDCTYIEVKKFEGQTGQSGGYDGSVQCKGKTQVLTID